MADPTIGAVWAGVVRKVEADRPRDPWKGSLFAEVRGYEIDTRGRFGELLVVGMLRAMGRNDVVHDDTTSVDKDWDIQTGGLDWEIKLATATSPSSPGGALKFQHESIDRTRHWHGLALVDVAPNDLYLTIMARKGIDWKRLHQRKSQSLYKLDTTLSRHPKVTLPFVGDNAVRTLDDFRRLWEAGEIEVLRCETEPRRRR